MDNRVDMPAQCNCTKVRRAARHITRFYDLCLAPTGLRTTQYAILHRLEHRGSMTMLELANAMTMDRATVGHNLRPLERDGLIRIQISKTDRRARDVTITKAGLARVALGRPGWKRAQAQFEKHVGAAKSADFRKMMDDLVDCHFETP